MNTTREVTMRELEEPRADLMVKIKGIKQMLVSYIDGGFRDYEKLQELVDQYISYQKAADMLGGYDVRITDPVEPRGEG